MPVLFSAERNRRERDCAHSWCLGCDASHAAQHRQFIKLYSYASVLAGDLGVQKGMLRWFISLYSPSAPISLRKDKLVDQDAEDVIEGGSAGGQNAVARATTPDVSSLPADPDALLPSTPKKKGKGKANAGDSESESGMALPPPFTPSINRTLNMRKADSEGETTGEVPPLPDGLTVAQMKTRLKGTKVKCVLLFQPSSKPSRGTDSETRCRGAFLTPKEMEALTGSWRPYRSLGESPWMPFAASGHCCVYCRDASAEAINVCQVCITCGRWQRNQRPEMATLST